MATQSASPFEAEAARRALETMPAPVAPKTLTRDDILAAPTYERPPTVRYYDPGLRVHVIMDDDDFLGYVETLETDDAREARRERLRRRVFGA